MAKNRSRIIIIGAIVLVLLLVGGGIYWILRDKISPGGATQHIPVSAGQPAESGGPSEMGVSETQIPFHLSEGSTSPQEAQPVPLATSEPLSEAEIDQILARLPALEAAPEEQVEFKVPPEQLPPPRTGGTKLNAFPPDESAVQPTPEVAGPLQVLRYSPEGEIPIAPFISVTFNQPMAPLETISELAAGDVPVKIDPPLTGTWRWLGTKTLTFQYDSTLIDRLPKATVYHLSVPAGTKSVTGGVLEKAVEWTFSTPPPKMVSQYPADIPQPQEPVIFVAFDQRITPEDVIKTIQVSAGSKAVDIRLATQDEIRADEQISRLAENSPDGRWIALRAIDPLPLDTAITVEIKAGTPSAEGPLTTGESQGFAFQTYAPLSVVDHGCSWSNDACRPLTPLYIRFNNPIDSEAFQDGMLKVQPELPGVSADIFGDTISIQGETKGQTTYTITVDGDIQDVFGQKMGDDASLKFDIGPAEPALAGPSQSFITLDPATEKPALSVYTINYTKLDVEIYAVQPSDWPAFKQYLRDYRRTDITPKIPGRQVFNQTVPVEAPGDALTEVDIDLKQVMDGDFGHFIVIVQPNKGFLGGILDDRNKYRETVQVWVQVTQIGLDAFQDHNTIIAWATALKDGAPLSGVTIKPDHGGGQVTTDDSGMAKFPTPDGGSYLVATRGNDTAILTHSPYYRDDATWKQWPVLDELRWYVFDDRQMYKPGEEVHVKGWLRRIGGAQDGDVGLLGEAVSSVRYHIIEPQGNEIGSGQASVGDLGGFDFTFKIPDVTNLGMTQVNFEADGTLAGLSNTQFMHGFQIQEFRRPEFEVAARNEESGPFFAGGSTTVAVEAKYYAGGPLPNAEVTWNVNAAPGNYDPPNWPDFTFGSWQPWWYYQKSGWGPGQGGGAYDTFAGTTDATGVHYLRVDFEKEVGMAPLSISAEATVMDVNRQAWTGSTSLLVHPADLYVGLHSQRYFVEKGKPLDIEFIVTDLDGNPVADRLVEMKAARLDWKYRGGQWNEEEADIQECKLGSKAEPVTCTFQTPVGGTYRITATVTDEKGRKNQTQFTRWVSGGQRPPSRRVEQESVDLIPDKETYQPGDTAEILVQAPFSPAEGLMTVTRSGILYTERFHIDEDTITLKVPVEEKYIPNLNIQVDLTGSAPRTGDDGEAVAGAPPRPAYASGQIELKIPPLQRTLALTVAPEKPEMEPGKDTSVAVTLKDHTGKPVSGAEVALVVVDEAILALSDYTMTDPIQVFYADRSSDMTSLYGRSSIILTDPLALAQEAVMQKAAEAPMAMPAEPAPMAMATMPAVREEAAMDEASYVAGSPAQPIAVRSNFDPLAKFAPAVTTDENGKARIALKLPDNLTRYRIMAVAVDGGGRQFGMAESNLVARLPLMVRTSPPRFLNFGDQFELPVVLQNQTGEPIVVDTAIRVSNIDLTAEQGYRVSIPARDRVEVRFKATTHMAGTAQFQVAAVSGSYSDASTVSLPVYTPATSEAFATYGVLDQGAAVQPLASPTGIYPQYGGLEIDTSSTALQSLTDAVLYLVAYPFECSEQLASRIMGVAALKDVLTAFKAEGLPSPDEMNKAVQRDIERLRGLQNPDGGFPYWRRGQESIPFNTIHVAHALQRAKEKGYTVPAEMQQPLLNYLRRIEEYYPHWYSEYTRNTLSAYALYVRYRMDDRDSAKAAALIDKAGLENLNLDAIGWLWPVLDKESNEKSREAIYRYVMNRAVETAGAANFTTSYDDQTYLLLGSNRRTDAILLDALIVNNPDSDLIPKLVNGLLAHKTKGRWLNTQENVFVLLALDNYFNTYESQTPDFVARIWLGDTYAGSHEYRQRTTERQETFIPMSYLVDQSGTQDLVIDKEGAGRLYYRLGLRYAPADSNLKPLDMGFVIRRSYEAVDDPGDVRQDDKGDWHIKAGARVRVRINMVADNRRYHVALTDPLPAGLEIVNPDLAISGNIPQDPNSSDYRYGWWWWGTWYEHQNMRDERAEAFTPLLWDGVYEYTYVARATTPGRFVVPPAKAEEMYSPEVFGRSASNVVIVE